MSNELRGVSNIWNPLIASYATKELPYRGIGTGILPALAAVPDLEMEFDPDRNLFPARIARKKDPDRFRSIRSDETRLTLPSKYT